MRKLQFITQAVVLLTAAACSDSKVQPGNSQFPSTVYTIDHVYDVGNNHDASDIRIRVMMNSAVAVASVTQVRVAVVPSASAFTEQDVMNLPEGRYYSPSSSETLIRLPAGMTDTEGNIITNAISYRVYVAAIGENKSVRLSQPGTFILTDKPVYAGKYVGSWRDPKLGSIGISLELNDDYSGKLYYTGNFKACCGGSEDASVLLGVSGAQITSFNANQFLTDYPKGTGGHCITTYSSTGMFTNDITLSLNQFPFSDCDGARSVTFFEMSKVQ